jgi:hypothetical protein
MTTSQQLVQAALNRQLPKKQIEANSVSGLVKAAVKIIKNEIKVSGTDYLIERVANYTDTTITKPTLMRWVKSETHTPHLSKLNAVLIACGYQLSLVKK